MKIKKVNELNLSEPQLEWFRNDKFNKSKTLFYVYEEELKDGFPQFRKIMIEDTAKDCIDRVKRHIQQFPNWPDDGCKLLLVEETKTSKLLDDLNLAMTTKKFNI